jgi:hypothetical protein
MYVTVYLATTDTIDNIFWILFILYMLAIYAIWMAAAWAGYPRGRHSLLVTFMDRFCGGKGELPEDNEEDDDENRRWNYGRNGAQHASEQSEDEAAEAEMGEREVMVMTIPKRRLTVVNV